MAWGRQKGKLIFQKSEVVLRQGETSRMLRRWGIKIHGIFNLDGSNGERWRRWRWEKAREKWKMTFFSSSSSPSSLPLSSSSRVPFSAKMRSFECLIKSNFIHRNVCFSLLTRQSRNHNEIARQRNIIVAELLMIGRERWGRKWNHSNGKYRDRLEVNFLVFVVVRSRCVFIAYLRHNDGARTPS